MQRYHTYTTAPERSTLRSFLSAWVMVHEGLHVVLIRDGRYHSVLEPGRHRIWPRQESVRTENANDQLVYVPGQEMLTSDGAGVRVTAVAVVRVVEPLALLRRVGPEWLEHLYLKVQLSARDLVAGLTLEDLLAQRTALGGGLTSTVAGWAEGVGLEVRDVTLRDLVVPGALKQAVAEVVTARLRGQAALERARGETAALRNLANAARAASDNPALLQLRLIQQMETASGNTYVIGTTMPLGPVTGVLPEASGRE